MSSDDYESDSPQCDYCGGTDLAYEMHSDRGAVCRCIPCLAIERGQAQFNMPFEDFIDNDVDGIVFQDEEEWNEHREISYTMARDWYRVLARIVQDDPLLKRDPDDFGTVNEHLRTSLTNIMGEDAHYPPSEVAGNKVSPGQMTFENLGDSDE